LAGRARNGGPYDADSVGGERFGLVRARGNPQLLFNRTDQLSYTGHFAFWDGDNYTAPADETTTTFDVHGRGSDGSNLTFPLVTHETATPNGVDLNFTRTDFKVNGKRCG